MVYYFSIFTIVECGPFEEGPRAIVSNAFFFNTTFLIAGILSFFSFFRN